MSDRQEVGVGGDQDAPVLDGPDQEGLVDRVFPDHVDRWDDVPAFVSETLDEGTGDVSSVISGKRPGTKAWPCGAGIRP